MYDDGQDDGAMGWYHPPPPRWRAPRWLVVGALVLAFVFTLGIGVALGSTILQTAQASSVTTAFPTSAQTPSVGSGSQNQGAGPGARGQCGVLTVSSVSGQTIIAKQPDGTSVTIHTTSSTEYTKAGQSATASAVTSGAQIHVDGTRNSDGSITATRIDVR